MEKQSKIDKKEKCCICGREIYGIGHNPEPVRFSGKCCDYCNAMYVLPSRVESLV